MKTTRGRIWNRSVTGSVSLASARLLFLGLSLPSERLSPLGLWASSIVGVLPVGLPSFRQSFWFDLRSAGLRALTTDVGITPVMLRKTRAYTEKIRRPLPHRED